MQAGTLPHRLAVCSASLEKGRNQANRQLSGTIPCVTDSVPWLEGHIEGSLGNCFKSSLPCWDLTSCCSLCCGLVIKEFACGSLSIIPAQMRHVLLQFTHGTKTSWPWFYFPHKPLCFLTQGPSEILEVCS